MSTFGYKQAIKARDAAYERKGGMTVGLPKATMAADHLALFVKEYEALEREQQSTIDMLRRQLANSEQTVTEMAETIRDLRREKSELSGLYRNGVRQ